MGVKNYLIEGVSCAGKTTVCDELQRRGFHCIHGDRELAYFGDRETGEALDNCISENRSWIWDVEKVRVLAADHSHVATFFCGGSRNSDIFIDLFDEVFVLEIDLDTLNRRLAAERRKNQYQRTPTACLAAIELDPGNRRLARIGIGEAQSRVEQIVIPSGFDLLDRQGLRG